MSKGNMLLGYASGKVGDLVFSRSNGQQIVRARAANVSNPQSQAQMIQRIIMNTVIQAYSRMSEITDHSFEGKSVGQDCMSKFMKDNLNSLRRKISVAVTSGLSYDEIFAFAPKGANLFTPNEWIIAAGSLPAVTIQSISATSGAVIAIASESAVPTYAEIIASLGLQRGDQLTFIGQELYTDARASFKFARVILDPREEDGTQAELTVPFIVDGVVNKPSPRNEGSQITFSSSVGSLTFDLGENSMFGAAVIVSRQKNDGNWLRSNTSIVLADAIPYESVGAYDLQSALDYTLAGGLDLQSDLYLNNAVRAKKITASSTPTPTPTPSTHTLTFTDSLISGVTADGTAVTSGGDVEAGATVVVSLAGLSAGSNYTIKVNNGSAIAVTKNGTTGSATFEMPSSNAAITVQSEVIPSTDPTLTIVNNSGETATITVDGNQIQSGATVQAGKSVQISIDAFDEASFTATVGDDEITLTKQGNEYKGSFMMPSVNSTLTIASA